MQTRRTENKQRLRRRTSRSALRTTPAPDRAHPARTAMLRRRSNTPRRDCVIRRRRTLSSRSRVHSAADGLRPSALRFDVAGTSLPALQCSFREHSTSVCLSSTSAADDGVIPGRRGVVGLPTSYIAVCFASALGQQRRRGEMGALPRMSDDDWAAGAALRCQLSSAPRQTASHVLIATASSTRPTSRHRVSCARISSRERGRGERGERGRGESEGGEKRERETRKREESEERERERRDRGETEENEEREREESSGVQMAGSKRQHEVALPIPKVQVQQPTPSAVQQTQAHQPNAATRLQIPRTAWDGSPKDTGSTRSPTDPGSRRRRNTSVPGCHRRLGATSDPLGWTLAKRLRSDGNIFVPAATTLPRLVAPTPSPLWLALTPRLRRRKSPPRVRRSDVTACTRHAIRILLTLAQYGRAIARFRRVGSLALVALPIPRSTQHDDRLRGTCDYTADVRICVRVRKADATCLPAAARQPTLASSRCVGDTTTASNSIAWALPGQVHVQYRLRHAAYGDLAAAASTRTYPPSSRRSAHAADVSQMIWIWRSSYTALGLLRSSLHAPSPSIRRFRALRVMQPRSCLASAQSAYGPEISRQIEDFGEQDRLRSSFCPGNYTIEAVRRDPLLPQGATHSTALAKGCRSRRDASVAAPPSYRGYLQGAPKIWVNSGVPPFASASALTEGCCPLAAVHQPALPPVRYIALEVITASWGDYAHACTVRPQDWLADNTLQARSLAPVAMRFHAIHRWATSITYLLTWALWNGLAPLRVVSVAGQRNSYARMIACAYPLLFRGLCHQIAGLALACYGIAIYDNTPLISGVYDLARDMASLAR
ncbi:hypothetical protein BDW22DRAFT_1450754 [Trametopsis cervina]|nr:hypothetical protein BDW22DRAFT_1450754 [Trametopsis cervina]